MKDHLRKKESPRLLRPPESSPSSVVMIRLLPDFSVNSMMLPSIVVAGGMHFRLRWLIESLSIARNIAEMQIVNP